MDLDITRKNTELAETLRELRAKNPQSFLSLVREIRETIREINKEFKMDKEE